MLSSPWPTAPVVSAFPSAPIPGRVGSIKTVTATPWSSVIRRDSRGAVARAATPVRSATPRIARQTNALPLSAPSVAAVPVQGARRAQTIGQFGPAVLQQPPLVSASPAYSQLAVPAPMAAIGVDTTHDGHANFLVRGVDRNRDGIPDVLQQPTTAMYLNVPQVPLPSIGPAYQTVVTSVNRVVVPFEAADMPSYWVPQESKEPQLVMALNGPGEQKKEVVEDKKEGFVGKTIHGVEDAVHNVEKKVMDTVHGVEKKVMDTVHGVENKVMDTVHGVENKVSSTVHNVEDKVSGFFHSVGNLFHRGGGKTTSGEKAEDDHAGPAGNKIGVGSSVEVQKKDGAYAKGHVVELPGASGLYVVQCHTAQRGDYTRVPADMMRPMKSYFPDVGSGVEVLHDGSWYTAHVVALPAHDHAGLNRFTVQCHVDPDGTFTFADQGSIRPFLSPQEKAVVNGHLQDERNAAEASAAAAKQQRKDARRAGKAAKSAEQKKAEDAERKAQLKEAASFQKLFEDNGLGQFHPIFVEHGYCSVADLADIHDRDLQAFGMKGGHILKFHAAFAQGATYVIYNGELQSTSAGLGYRPQKNAEMDAHKIAPWDSKVKGIDQLDGWLKVGLRYLPMTVKDQKGNDCVVIYAESRGPPQAKTMLSRVEDKVEGCFFSAKHGLAHMMHLDGGGQEEKPPDAGDSSEGEEATPAPEGVATPVLEGGAAEEAVDGAGGASASSGDAATAAEAKPAVSQAVPAAETLEEKPKEGVFASAKHGLAHMLHLDGGADAATPAEGAQDAAGGALERSSKEALAAKPEVEDEGCVASAMHGMAHMLHLDGEESCVESAKHGLAHMLHLDGGAEAAGSRVRSASPPALEAQEVAKPAAGASPRRSNEDPPIFVSSSPSLVNSHRQSAEAVESKPQSEAPSAQAKAEEKSEEGAFASAKHGLAHMLHLDGEGEAAKPADGSKESHGFGSMFHWRS